MLEASWSSWTDGAATGGWRSCCGGVVEAAGRSSSRALTRLAGLSHPADLHPVEPMGPSQPANEGSPRHLYSIGDLDRRDIERLLDLGDRLQRGEGPGASVAGKVIGLLFFQSSTRTRTGFHAAAARLGVTAVYLGSMRYEESMSRPEHPEDAFRAISAYFDLVVLRHADEQGFLRMLASSSVPVINGGCGERHHPTQTLIDLSAVRSRFGRLDGLRWGLAGDLARSRAARSLIEALAGFEVKELRLMCPPGRSPSFEEAAGLVGLSVRWLDRLDPTEVDILYMAGHPSRPGCGSESEQDRARLRLTLERARALPEKAVILCPLPRIDEIERAVDRLPQAAYFQQSEEGLFVRMAILERALSPGSSAAPDTPA